jgi:hypothetical protein
MRIGISPKSTQPNLTQAGHGVPGDAGSAGGIVRTSVALNITDTWVGDASLETRLPTGATNTDTRYYNVEFPYSWVKWSAYSYGSAPAAADIDPFSAYRESGSPVIDATTGRPSLPPINTNLDITITIPTGTVIGGYTHLYLFNLGIYPSLQLFYSDSTTYSSFTEEAAKNLKITINNSGSIGGAGGIGGWGDNDAVVKSARDYGGGGGSGAGIHRDPTSPLVLNDWSGSGSSGDAEIAGIGGHQGGSDTDGTSGEPGTQGRWHSSAGTPTTYDSSNRRGFAGPAGAGSTGQNDDSSAVKTTGAGDGGRGGAAIAIRNPLTQLLNGTPSGPGETWALNGTYASDWVSNWSGGGGPELIVNNESGGYIRGGGGGGGGGSAQSGSVGGAGGIIGVDGNPGIGSATSGADSRGDAGSFENSVIANFPLGTTGFTQQHGPITKTNANAADYSFYPDGATEPGGGLG